MKEQKAKQLLEKYADGKADPEEKRLVESWYLKFFPGNFLSKEELQHEHDLGMIRLDAYFGRQRRNLVLKIAAVAAVMLMVTGVFIYNIQYKGIKERISLAQDIPPGKRRALLTLSNGKTIRLNEAKYGIKIGGKELSYSDGTALGAGINMANADALLVTQTPRGGTYQVTLSDGTIVILNAESTLKFPHIFKGKERRVELKGEAYFEVAKNKNMPFIVKSLGQQVTVLGTHFNVNTQSANGLKTTLLEGSIRLDAGSRSLTLLPGQQANFENNQLTILPADLDAVIAWKEGYFRFNDESIQEIMLKISRWYDVEIIYEGDVTHEVFTGAISRFSNISDVLDMLERTKIIHFKLEGRRVTVLN